jgi:hypothetical protein
MLSVSSNLKRVLMNASSLVLVFFLSISVADIAKANRTEPRCKDVKAATSSVNRNTAAVARYQARLEADKKWMNAASAVCTNSATPTPTPKPTSAACTSSQYPKQPVLENGVCMQYVEIYYTCLSEFNAYAPLFPNTEVTYKSPSGYNGPQWQRNIRYPRDRSVCP